MDEPRERDQRDDHDLRALWSEAVWGVGLIGAVLATVSIIAALGP
jgi:hypothetical protein